jgi:hypothetical protein
VALVSDWFNDPEGEDPPEWASFFDGPEFARFLQLVRAELDRRALTYALDDGVISLESDTGGNRMGLQNLAQKCHATGDPAAWPGVIAEHFGTTLGGFAEMSALDRQLADLSAVRDRLKLRVYPQSMRSSLPEAKLVWWPLTDDLMVVLTLDLPSSVVTVSSDTRERWSIADDALFDVARENIAREDTPTVEDLDEDATIAIRALYGESFFIASHMLHVARFVDPPEHGLLLAVPHRHALLMHRIVDASVVLAINTLLGMTHRMHLEGPGSISSQLYWWRDGRLMHLPSQVEGGTLRFMPPPAFVDQVLTPLTRR